VLYSLQSLLYSIFKKSYGTIISSILRVQNWPHRKYCGFIRCSPHLYKVGTAYCLQNQYNMACSHADWLSVRDYDQTTLARQSGRLRSIVRSLPSPSLQYPSMVLFLESRNKRILTDDHPCKTIPGTVQLCLDSYTKSSINPILIGNAFPLAYKNKRSCQRIYNCCSTVNQQYINESALKFENRIYSQILYPFVDVFCFIYSVPSDLNEILQYLTSWAECLKSSATNCVSPEILVFFVNKNYSDQHSIEAQAQLQDYFNRELSALFSGLTSFQARKDNPLGTKWCSRVRSIVSKAIGRGRRRREAASLLFAADHFSAFTEKAFKSATLQTPFNFIQSSRSENPVAETLVKHITNFVRYVDTRSLTTFAAQTIASSLLLDHFPPDMHGTSITILH
jgi:hypothetical protein